MAYAGTPTGLAQQAGASRPWKTVLAAIAVLAIGLALVIAVMFVNSRPVAPATGRDDSVIEAQRDATLLSGGTASKVLVGVQALAPSSDIFDPMTIHQWSSAGRDDGLIEAQRDATLLSGTAAAAARAETRLDAISVDRKYQEIQSHGK